MPAVELQSKARSAPGDRAIAMPLAVTAIVLLVLATYSGVADNGFLRLDDDVYVTNNPQVLQGLRLEGIRWAFEAPHSFNYHPLTWLSHMLDVSLFGADDAGPHHQVNALLHTANSVLLFLALRALAGGSVAPLMAALLFALHPMRVESVAWLAERKDVLSGFFFLASLLVYAGYARRGGAVRYGLLLLCFGSGLLAKSMLVTLPCVLLLLDDRPLRRFGRVGVAGGAGQAARAESPARLVVEKLPLFALTIATAVMTVVAQGADGAIAGLAVLGPVARVANAFSAYGGYLVGFVLPVHLSIFYPHPAALSASLPIDFWLNAAASTLVLLALSFACWRLRRRAPYALVGWLWFLGMLVPVIGLVQVGVQSMADRYSYLPSIGLSIALAWGLEAWLQRRPRLRSAAYGMVACILLLLGFASYRYVERFESTLTLFRHASEVTENNYLAFNQIGMVYQERGDLTSARRAFLEALRIKPDYDWAHQNLGINYWSEKRYADAEKHWRLAILANPRHVEARSNLGVLLQAFGRFDEAYAILQEALALQPGRAEVLYNLGLTTRSLGRPEEAEGLFLAALESNPALTSAYKWLGAVAAESGRHTRALQYLQQAVALHPEDAEARALLQQLQSGS